MTGQKVYVTKFALEKGILHGIIQEKIRMHSDYPKKVTLVYKIVTDEGTYLLEQDDFGNDPEDAVRKAGKMRDDEIRNLKKRIQELKLMQFSC